MPNDKFRRESEKNDQKQLQMGVQALSGTQTG
jgi:hypothetical protein